MKRTILIAGAAVLVLVAVGAGAWVWATGQTGGTGASPNAQAAQQFFTERNGGTPVAGNNTLTFGTGPGGVATGGPPGAVGTVAQVDGNRITLKNPMDGTTTTVQLDATTKIQKQAEATAAEITPGVHLVAVGPKQGTAIAAAVVNLGGATDAPGAGPMQMRVEGGSGGSAPTTMPERVSGTVEQVSGTTITVKTDDGASATVELAATTAIFQQVDIPASAIAVGDLVLAQGTRQGDVFAATEVQVSTGGAMMMQPAAP
jgi:hypothetical protein